MVKFNKNNVISLVSMLVLMLGFQNCGSSSFQNIDAVQGEPASSLITGDTKYKQGLDFAVMSMASGSSDLKTDFKVSKNDKKEYILEDESTTYTCTFETPNSSEELLQITEISTLSHPSMISSAFDVCDSSGGEDVYYSIGRQSKIYLVAKDENEDCYSGDPQKLIDQNKRVFVVDNIFIGDIQNLLDNVGQDALNESNCASFTATVE